MRSFEITKMLSKTDPAKIVLDKSDPIHQSLSARIFAISKSVMGLGISAMQVWVASSRESRNSASRLA